MAPRQRRNRRLPRPHRQSHRARLRPRHARHWRHGRWVLPRRRHAVRCGRLVPQRSRPRSEPQARRLGPAAARAPAGAAEGPALRPPPASRPAALATAGKPPTPRPRCGRRGTPTLLRPTPSATLETNKQAEAPAGRARRSPSRRERAVRPPRTPDPW
eukprot:scaffold13357_cov100-Isochrysis_galbana.AAC.6